MRYANVVPGNYTFQAKGSIFINSNFNKGVGQSVFTKDNLSENIAPFTIAIPLIPHQL
ncbi:hypothetical protein BPO_p0087 (plasmid) [Bergeyella porcorum]|uniref:Uncharacterized protein n=1 Tax=Bergeyella porcorum TaxID=1735111 RepID=A0AAU0F716_9FLAO